jgi:hypothetical protein
MRFSDTVHAYLWFYHICGHKYTWPVAVRGRSRVIEKQHRIFAAAPAASGRQRGLARAISPGQRLSAG